MQQGAATGGQRMVESAEDADDRLEVMTMLLESLTTVLIGIIGLALVMQLVMVLVFGVATVLGLRRPARDPEPHVVRRRAVEGVNLRGAGLRSA